MDKRKQIQKIYSMSPMQEGILFHSLLDKNPCLYLMQLSLDLAMNIDMELLNKSFNILIERYDIFRTVFVYEKQKKPQQVVLKEYHSEVYFEDISLYGENEKILFITQFERKDRETGFDLAKKDILIRISLLKTDNDYYRMIWSCHHILIDGWSLGIVAGEFFNIYQSLKENTRLNPEITYPYSDYINWLEKQDKEKASLFWKECLKDYGQLATLPKQGKASGKEGYKQEKIRFTIDEALTKGLETIAKTNQVTLNTVLQTIWGVLLQKYNNAEDVIFGSTVSGRLHNLAGIEKMIGLLINTIPVRIKCDKIQSFSSLIKQVHRLSLLSQQYDYLPLYEIQSNSSLKRGLFDHIIAFENYPLEKGFINSNISDMEVFVQAHYDLDVLIIPDSKLEVILEYNAFVYDRYFLQRLEGHFKEIIKRIVGNSDVLVKEIEILTEEESRQILVDFNDTKVEYPKDKTVHELFEKQVEKTPDNTVVVFEGEKLTYGELNNKANQVAGILRKKGINRDGIVGIMIERSLEMIIGIIGILKSGGAYLPIDCHYPQNRVLSMLNDSGAFVLLTTKEAVKDFSSSLLKEELNQEIILLDDLPDLMPNKAIENLCNINSPEDLAYIIYTSGSTGKPNGTMIEHKDIINLVTGLSKNIYERYESRLNVAIVAPYIFDPSVQQMFASLLLGHKLFIVPEKARLDGKSLVQYYIKNSIDVSDGTPTHVRIILDNISPDIKDINVKHFIIGGEALPVKVVKCFLNRFDDKMPEITNIYGPTECCVDSTAYLITGRETDEWTTVPIGTPLANRKIYILDNNLKIVPIGVSGEMYIAGEGIGRGYLNNPDLTAKRFVPDLFTPGERMFKTGDLARWLSDGNIEFLGRIDRQVKIRGYRMELEEIESQLLRYNSVKAAVVIDKEDENGDKDLYAYVVSDEELIIPGIREYLSRELPDYMIPSYFIQLDAIPLTPNGKVDRKVLFEHGGGLKSGEEYAAPVNGIEKRLVSIWQDILKSDNIGLNDDFFELGGHSLKATVLVKKIHKEFNVEIPLTEVFTSPTVKGLAEYIESAKENIYSSIKPVEEKEYYPVSSAQKRLLIVNQLVGGNITYNSPSVMLIEGCLDRVRFEKAFKALVRRHETLRTSFEFIGGEPVQKVHEDIEFEITYIESEEDEIKDIVKGFIRPFDLSKAPLLRIELVILSEYKHVLLYDMHHIICDGMSTGILIKEFVKLYDGKELPELRLQYKDFSIWQNELFKTSAIKKQEEYWLNKFNGEIPLLDMPVDYPRPLMQSFEGDRIVFKAGKELVEALSRIAAETGTTLYMVLLAAYNILLSKYTGQEDIIIGSPIAGRQHADLENIIGMFVNMIAIRNYPKHNITFRELLQEVKKNALEAYENQDYQYEELVEKLDIRRDLSRNPLFEIVFVLQNLDNKAIDITGYKFAPYEFENKVSKFDLTLTATELKGNIEFSLEYCSKLYKRQTIERLIKHFVNILGRTVENPDVSLSEIDMLSEEEKRQILYEFNNTKAEFPRNKTIHELFEEQAEKTPDNIGIAYGDKELTYRELNNKSNQLARVLRQKGITADSIVAIMVEPSLEMIIGILGILKAGGAYLPIDPEYPEERIKYMLEDSGVDILLTQRHLKNKVEFEGQIINIGDDKLYHGDDTNLKKINTPRDLAYIIYTSGTTGKPKGTMIEHRNVVRLFFNDKMQFDFSTDDVWTMFHSFCFDFSVWEIYGALLYGGKLVVVPRITAQWTKEYLKLLKKEKVTILNQTPTAFYNLINEELEEKASRLAVRYVIFGGEALKPIMLSGWRKKYPGTKLINMYGITETTVHVTYKEITEREIEESISNIGKPIPTLTTYIMNKNLQLVPVGVPGEICVGGDGVGRGYLNRPELTAERFVQNPYNAGERLYKSGDLARILPDGDMEYLGRIDHQVKIRGHRIELGEIEYALLKHELVKEAVVTAKEDKDGSRSLCAYVVSPNSLMLSELREYLSKELPDYMIPSYFVQLEKMPLTPNGKVDRRALPKLGESINTGIEYAVPRDEIEVKLANIWQEVLGIEKVGINDNFFELGGHSLKATMLVSEIHKMFNVEIPLKEVFSRQTIRELGECIKGAEVNIYASIERIEEREYYPVSSAQKRLFILNQIEDDNVTYNMPFALFLKGGLEKGRIEEIFKALVKRHETMRTSFELIGGEPVQKVRKEIDFHVSFMEAEEDKVEDIIKEFIQPFDLSKAPLLRVILIKLSEDKHILLCDMHHIISDGTSLAILLQEFVKLYGGQELPELRVQYKDFSEWQNRIFNSGAIKKQETYWQETFSGEIPVLNTPADYPRPSIQRFEGDEYKFELNKILASELRRLTAQKGTTIFMTLLAAYNVLLSRLTGQEDIIVGMPVSGRNHSDLSNIVGMFINTVALRSYPRSSKNFDEFLEEVKVNVLKTFENQDYQFEMLLDKLKLQRDLGRNPLFDTVFNFLNFDVNFETAAGGLEFTQYAFENKTTKFDIVMYLSEVGGKIKISCIYKTDLFKRSTIEYIMGEYIRLLEEIILVPNKPLKAYEIFSKKYLGTGTSEVTLKAAYEKFKKGEINKSIVKRFEEQAEKHQDRPAVKTAKKVLSYGSLNKNANRIAYAILDKFRGRECVRKTGQEKSGQTAAILFEHDTDMIIGMIGVLKAGKIYVPLDPSYPEERLKYILDDSGAELLVTNSSNSYLAEKLRINTNIDIVNIDTIGADIPGENLNIDIGSESIAYIMYTSGSTGRPKGVIQDNRNIIKFIGIYTNMLHIGYSDRIALFSSYSHTVGVIDILSALLNGAVVYPYNIKSEGSMERLSSWLQAEGITIYHSIPAVYRYCMDMSGVDWRSSQIRAIVLGGEAVYKKDVEVFRKHFNDDCIFVNLFGSTEVVIAAAYLIGKETEVTKISIPVGYTVEDVEAHLLNENGEEAGVYEIGEIVYESRYLAVGYWNQEDKTRESFGKSPFNKEGRVYRSGDLGRLLPDGSIEFIGRKDFQVKIRGYRVELGEIEAVLDNTEGVKKSIVVLFKKENGGDYLSAYYTTENGIKVEAGELRAALRRKLPDYMVPVYFVYTEKLPLTPGGKIDRKALPEPEGVNSEVEYTAPQNEIEEKLAAVWQEILGIEKVGVNDNFFDLGGNSLLVIRMHSSIDRMYPGKTAIVNIFSFPTIRKLAEFIKIEEKAARKDISLSMLIFPPEYIIDKNEINRNIKSSVFQFNIKEEYFEKIKKISVQEKIELSDILLSIYIYLLSKIAVQKEVTVQVMINDINQILSLCIDLTYIENFPDLFKLVNRKSHFMEGSNTYRLQDLSGINPVKDKNSIIPLFYKRSRFQEKARLPGAYDIILEINEEFNKVDFTCEYNTGRLKEEKVLKLIGDYGKIIRLVADQYDYYEYEIGDETYEKDKYLV